MSSFAEKKRKTVATRKRTRQRLEGTGEDGGRRGPAHLIAAGQILSSTGFSTKPKPVPKRTGAGFKKPEPWAARLAARAEQVEGPRPEVLSNAKLEIMVVASASEKRDTLLSFLNKLREREAKARQKTRVLIFTELNRTAKQLEGKIGNMVAVKTPSRGYRGLGFGSATRTSYENIGATSMVAGMQESYVGKILSDFSSGKNLTVLGTDKGMTPMEMHAGKVGHVICFDSPESLLQHRERCAYAGKGGATFTLVWSRTRKEKEDLGDVITWMEEQGCVLPREVREDMGLGDAPPVPAADGAGPQIKPPPQQQQDDIDSGPDEDEDDWESLVDADEVPPPPPPAPLDTWKKTKKKKKKRPREEKALSCGDCGNCAECCGPKGQTGEEEELPGWDRQLAMLRTLTQLDETGMDGASAGADARCSEIPAHSIVQEEQGYSIVQEEKAKKAFRGRGHLKHKKASEQDGGALRALEQISEGSMKRKKQKKNKKKRGASLLGVVEH